jgi:hypothetical protein
MAQLLNYPLVLFGLSGLTLWLATHIGTSLLRRKSRVTDDDREDFNTILVTTLTLNGLIIGFSFSMAINRYEQRKNYEEAEANAIGTEYSRADLLPSEIGDNVRSLLGQYLDLRISFYTSRDEAQIRQINIRTEESQSALWAAVSAAAAVHPTPIIALTVAGMNDVLNAQGYTQAAWWNRIPVGAWILMAAIALTSHLLLGYGAQSAKAESRLFLVLPFVVAVSFLLIADIDSPRSGFIRVRPQNLISLAASLHHPHPDRDKREYSDQHDGDDDKQ